jgi:hypothetical protein
MQQRLLSQQGLECERNFPFWGGKGSNLKKITHNNTTHPIRMEEEKEQEIRRRSRHWNERV